MRLLCRISGEAVSGNKTVDDAVKNPHTVGMLNITYLIRLADAYKTALGMPEDTTVSYRVFGDTKKLAAIRSGADLTTRRYNAAIAWFRDHWPEGHRLPCLEGSLATELEEGNA
jgi:hypothetical protein